MNEYFLKYQKAKISLEKEVREFEISKFEMPSDTKNLTVDYVALSERLKSTSTQLLNRLNELKNGVQEFKATYGQDIQKSAVQKGKLDSLVEGYKDIEGFIVRVSKIKAEKLRQQKEELYLFSGATQRSTNNEQIEQLMQQNDSLNQSHQKVEESIQIGEEVLNSLHRQSSTVKRIQNKVNVLIGDMGLSQGIIKLIGNRDTQDKRIVIFLSCLLFIFIMALYYCFK